MMPFDSDTHGYLKEQRQLVSCLSKNLTDTTLDSDSPCAVYKGPPPEAGCQDENNIANKSTMSFTLGRMKWAAHMQSSHWSSRHIISCQKVVAIIIIQRHLL